jgi:hypothetical protein
LHVAEQEKLGQVVQGPGLPVSLVNKDVVTSDICVKFL